VVRLDWNDGFAIVVEQPELVPSVELVFQTDSVHPRVLFALVSEVPPTAVTYAPHPAHIHQIGAGEPLRDVVTLVPRVLLFRHARRTHTIWQYWHVPALSGLLPPSPAPPGQGCPQLHRPAATGRR
jgi:hypothetical protein